MATTSRPIPGSARSVVDVVIRLVSEGRYRQGHLHLLYHARRTALDEVTVMVNEATSAPELPPGITADLVIASGKPDHLPEWLEPVVDAEIKRIFAQASVRAATPAQLVARVVAAISIDTCADRQVPARSRPDGTGAPLPAADSHRRLIDIRPEEARTSSA